VTPEQRVIAAARAHYDRDTPDTYAALGRALLILDGKDVDPEPPVWVPATWADVSEGDRVRLAGEEANVSHHRGYMGGHALVRINSADYTMPMRSAVEILADARRRKELQL